MQKPSHCESCPLYSSAGPVPSQGNYQNAKLILITDKPSQVDCDNQLPFSDGTGNVLNKILYESGLRRSQVFITSLLKCNPRALHGPPLQSAIEQCNRFITKDLERCKSDTVLLLGDGSFNHYIGSYSTIDPGYQPPSNVYARKGCVEQRFNRKWIGTLHPRDYMSNVQVRDEVIGHFRKASAISNVTLPLPQVYETVSDADVIRGTDLIREVGAFANDVETYQPKDIAEDDYVGGNYEVDMGGVSIGEWNAMVLDPSQLHLLGPLFMDQALWRYEHNGMYDQYHFARLLGLHTLYRDGLSINPHNHWMDGMLAAHYANSTKFKYLKPDCLSRYTRLPYYDRKLEHLNRRLYNGYDCIATHQECDTLMALGKSEGWWDTFIKIGMEVLPVLEEQRVQGVNIDVPKAALFHHIFQLKLAKVEEMAQALVPEGIEAFNPHHHKKLFYDIWGLPVQTHKKTKKASTDFEARKRLAAWIEKTEKRRTQYADALQLITLIDYYAGEKKKSEYLDRISPDAKIHPFFKAHGQEFFRLSSQPNLQNFPVYEISDWGGARQSKRHGDTDPLGFGKAEYGSLRSLIIPDDPANDLILNIDFNQIQLWIYAAICGSKWLKATYDSGDYIYGTAYEKLYNEPFFAEGKPRTKEHMHPNVPEQRIRIAKAVPLGFLFGRTGGAVATEQGWTLAEGDKLRQWWFGLNPELQASHAATELEMWQRGYIRHEHGVRTYHPDMKVNEALNSRAQVGEAMIVLESMALINRAFKERGWTKTRIMLTVHDAITMNIHNAQNDPLHLIDVYDNIVEPICTRPIPQFKGWKFRIEGTVSTMWDYKTIKYHKWRKERLGEVAARPSAVSNTATR